ncbi:MAG: hypothetical protein IJX77_07410 [Ruminococcus sp.]|nr:hypothetical protein [Ruminococcus sp.]
MAFFKKKNKAAEAESTGKDIKQLVLESLNDKLQGTLYDGCVIMPKGFTIDIQVGRNEVRDEVHLLQVIYIVKHDEFDEPIIEPVDSQGKTEEDAIKMSVEIFFGGLWHPLNQSTQKKNPTHISVNYLMQHYDFDMYAQSIVRIGVSNDKEPTAIMNFIKSEIPKFLGSKKYYWVRIFLAKYKDKEIVEVRINGTVCSTLHRYFKEYIESWGPAETFVSEKQYMIFVQREDDKCPFKKKLVIDAAKKTIPLMEACNSPEAYQEMMRQVEEFTEGNRALAAEIRIFIPEILAKLTMGYQEGDSLFLMQDDSNIEFKKTQLRSYFYIQQAVLDYLQKKPEKERVMKIVSNSVAFRELKKAHEAGHEPKDLFVPGTSYKIGLEDYKVW